MISELKIRNFKSLESVDLKLGHFNLLVGANASGKSNFLDALRFLQGVGSGLSLDETLNGTPSASTNIRWAGIRGGSSFVAFRSSDGTPAEVIELHTSFNEGTNLESPAGGFTYNLTCSVNRTPPLITHETVDSAGVPLISDELRFSILPITFHPVTDSDPMLKGSDEGEIIPDQTRSMLATLSSFAKLSVGERGVEHLASPIRSGLYVASSLNQMQFLDPMPSVLRTYSSKVARLGERGEGFAALIHEIEMSGNKPALLDWLKELRPDEVSDLRAISGAVNDYMAAITERKTEFPAPTVSEGTLRFIALAAAFFQPSMPKVLVIEEIEKGLHPSRLRLLLELMRSQSKRTGTQVFATTHSPTLLAWLTEEDRKTTFVCTRDAESGATKMRSLADIPRFEELLEEGSQIDELFAEGWLESAPQ